MDNCEKQWDAVHNIVTVRLLYSEACAETFSQILETKHKIQKAKINVTKPVLPQPTEQTEVESNTREYLKNISFETNNSMAEMNELYKKIDNLYEVVDQINKVEHSNLLEVIKALGKKYMRN